MVEDNIKCPNCGSINIERHWGDKILKGGAKFIGGFIEGYFLGGSGETGGDIASGLIDEISQKYECRSCGFTFTEKDFAYRNFDNKDEKVCKGKSVKISYKLYNDANGELLFETPRKAPELIVYGISKGIIPGLECVIEGLGTGDRFSVTLSPEVAFGLRAEEYVMQLSAEIFMQDGKMAVVKEGDVLDMCTDTGDIVSGRVIKLTPEFVLMDFNHPFAGMTIFCEGKIIEVNDTTQQDTLSSNYGGNCKNGNTPINDKKDNNLISKDITNEDKEYLDELKVIYSDNGQVSERERRLLNKLRISLGISEDRAKELEDLAKTNSLNGSEMEYTEEIKACLEDNGSISERERSILNKLAASLNISLSRAEELERLITNKK